MKADQNWLEETLRAGLDAQKAGADAECPSPDDLARLVTGEAGRKERARTLDHVAGCGECAKLLKSLLRISDEFDRVAAEAGARRKPKLVPSRRTVLAAVAALAGMIAVTYSIVRLSERPVVRGTAGVEVRLVSPKPGAALAAGDIEFKWEAVPKASHYTVELFGASLEKIWRSGPITGTKLKLPEDARRIILGGETYFWRVTAVLEDGQGIVSKLAEFSIPK